jgi:hypothetical protein
MSSETPIAETPTAETPTAETPTDTTQTTNDNYYDNTTMMMTIAFLGIYFSVYAFSGMFFKNSKKSI